MMRLELSMLLLALPALAGCDALARADATNAASRGHTPGSTNAARANATINLQAALGADLLYWWEPSPETVTLNGANVSQLNDRVAGAHAVQASAGNQPLYEATGGPNGRPCIALSSAGLGTDNHLIAPIAIGAGNRVGIYVVSRPGAGGDRVMYTGGGTSQVSTGTTQHRHILAFTGGTQTMLLTVPALSDTWQLHALRPLATGALSEVNGVTTTPNFTGTDTRSAQTLAYIGHPSVSGGSLAMLLMVNDPIAAKNTLIRQYVAQKFGIQ